MNDACLERENILRRVSNLNDVQIVLNDILNRLSPIENSIMNRRGYRIANLGEAQNDDDAVTLGQAKALIKNPEQQLTEHFYTQVWSNQNAPSVGDVLPPFVIVENGRVGQPIAFWAAAHGAGSGSSTFNVQLDRDGFASPINLLQEDLVLGATDKLVTSRKFISPVPFLGINSLTFPTIVSVGGHTAVSLGLVVRRVR